MEIAIAVIGTLLIVWWGVRAERKMLNPPEPKEMTPKQFERFIKRTYPELHQHMVENGESFEVKKLK